MGHFIGLHLQLEEIWNHTFNQALQINTQGMSVLLTEPPLASSTHRENLVESMIEVFELSEVNLSIQGILALYA